MSSAPSYQRVVRDLREQVTSGAFGPSGRMPTEEALASQYGVSRQTVRRAFQELVADGLVDRARGRGTFVRPPGALHVRQMGSIDDLMGLSSDTSMEVLSPLEMGVDVTASSRLQLEDDVVGRLTFRRSHEGIPFCVTDVRLPASVAATLLATTRLGSPGEASGDTVIGLIEHHLDRQIAEALQSITVALADDDTAAALCCDPGHPTLRIDRLYLDEDGRPIELAVSHFLPERYSYRTRLRRTR